MQFRFHAVNEKFAQPDDPNFFTGAEFYLLNGLITLNDICKKSKKTASWRQMNFLMLRSEIVLLSFYLLFQDPNIRWKQESSLCQIYAYLIYLFFYYLIMQWLNYCANLIC